MSKYMINSINVLPLCSYGFRDSPTTTTFKRKKPAVVLLKATTTSTNDDIREIKALQQAWFAVLNKLKGEATAVDFTWRKHLFKHIGATPLDGRLALEVALNILQICKL